MARDYCQTDGPGVGKGRQAAGIILENYLHGRERALWLSVSGDLVADARRDIEDIGGGKVACHNLRDFRAGLSLERQGVKKGILFVTYSLLISERSGAAKVERARLQQVVDWCGADTFEGAVILDECHRAKNMGSGKAKGKADKQDDDPDAWRKTAGTKSAQFVASLQEQLPKARIGEPSTFPFPLPFFPPSLPPSLPPSQTQHTNSRAPPRIQSTSPPQAPLTPSISAI